MDEAMLLVTTYTLDVRDLAECNGHRKWRANRPWYHPTFAGTMREARAAGVSAYLGSEQISAPRWPSYRGPGCLTAFAICLSRILAQSEGETV